MYMIELHPNVANTFFFSLCLYSPLDLGRFFSFLMLYTVGRTHWRSHQTVGRPLPAHRTAQTQNKRTQTSMRRLGFEPMTPASERRSRFMLRPRGHYDRRQHKIYGLKTFANINDQHCIH
jgi:hypothetical protein